MAPTVRVDDEVYKALQARAVPFQDTPNSVMRRVLGLPQMPDPADEGEGAAGPISAHRASRPRPRSGAGRRAAKGSILAESEYEVPLLQALVDLGGSASAADVLTKLEPKIEGQLTDLDREPLPSGRLRWHNRAQFARLNLVRRGELSSDSPRGLWEITEAGRMRLRESA